MTASWFGQGNGMVAVSNVECNPSIHCTLLQCQCDLPHDYEGDCEGEDAGVRCEQKKMVRSVSAANVTSPNCSTLHTVLINVTLNNSITNLFQVECYNHQHEITLYVNNSVNNETNSLTTHQIMMRGLFPSSFYTCCTSAIMYCQQYAARATCIDIETPNNSTETSNPVDSRISESKALMSVGLVGGILGFVILILLIALVCLLQPNLKKLIIPKR